MYRNYYLNNRAEIIRKNREYYFLHPEIKILRTINQRCNNPKSKDYKNYGAKGIKNFLTRYDIIFLMKRDNYFQLKSPSIDRKNSKKDYTLENCQFIEHNKNSGKDKIRTVLQYSLKNEFIKEWKSQKEIELNLGIDQANISRCCNNIRESAYGFLWKFKNVEQENNNQSSVENK